jgi:hypothetical protein
MVYLSNGHIIISKEIAESHFGDSAQVNWVFYPKQNAIMIAAMNDELFKSLHKTSMSMLKYKNDSGQRSISVQEVLLDHDIDPENRELDFKADATMKVLTVYFLLDKTNPAL